MKKDGVVKKEREMVEFKLKTSRLSFIWNYFIVLLIVIFTLLAVNAFNWKFTLQPASSGELLSTIVMLVLFLIGALLLQQPEMVKLIRQYTVTSNEVVEMEGLLNKRKVVLPYASISEITVRMTPIGRMFKYGDVFIGAFRSGSDINMKGIKHPHKIHEIIQNRINFFRKKQLDFWERQKETKD